MKLREPKTAIEWLKRRYHERQGYLSEEDFAEALTIEQEQIEKSFTDGNGDYVSWRYINGQDYFNKKYGTNTNDDIV